MEPIFSTGTFGTHILDNPSGTYSFFGEVPDTCKGSFATFEDALDSFFEFFKSAPVEWQRENAQNLRNDIFVKMLERA